MAVAIGDVGGETFFQRHDAGYRCMHCAYAPTVGVGCRGSHLRREEYEVNQKDITRSHVSARYVYE
jgi:hypothetical protein